MVLLAACAPAAAPSPTATPAPSAAPTHLAVSYTQLPTTPNLAALTGGIFRQHDLDVDLRRIPQGATGMQALLAGDTQIAELGGAEALAAAANGADVVVLANLVPVYVYKLMATPTISTLADLKGKRVGITNEGSVDATATRSALKRLGLASDDVTLVPVGPEDARVAALSTGVIDATDATPLAVLTLESRGFHALFDYATLGIGAAVTTIVARRAWLDAHRELAQQYVDSLVIATAREKSDHGFVAGLLRSSLNLQDQRAIDALIQTYVDAAQPALPFPRPEQYTDTVDQLAEQNPNIRSVDLNRLLDPSYIQRAADRGLDRAAS